MYNRHIYIMDDESAIKRILGSLFPNESLFLDDWRNDINQDYDDEADVIDVTPIEPKSRPLRSRVRGLDFEDPLNDVQQVIYNDPATVVTFKDGTKVCVKACGKDTFNKEVGLMYAIIKRMYANHVDPDTGYLTSEGLGKKINSIIASAIDQKDAEKIRRKERKLARKRAKKLADEAKAKIAAKEKLANEVSEQAAKEAVDQIYEKKNA